MALATSLLLTGALFAQSGNTGYLKTKVRPGRPGVFVDGKIRRSGGKLPDGPNICPHPGEHEITLAEPRYRDHSTKVNIRSGETVTLSRSLEQVEAAKPPFGQLRIAGGAKFTAVYVNGRYMGHTDEFNGPGQRLLLNPGEYTVKIAPISGAAAHDERVTIRENELTVVKAGM
jgi:hypothetical protein